MDREIHPFDNGVGHMQHGGSLRERFELPENLDGEFDERALERAIRQHREREFAALAQLNN